MKNFTKIFFTLAILVALYSCGASSGNDQSKNTKGDQNNPEIAVCIWDKVALREAASESSKWLTALSLGEKVFFLNETAVDSSVAKPVEFIKIKLLDDKEGWVRSDFVVIDTKPAVFLSDANFYSRPDLMTKSNNVYSRFDIIAAKEEQNGWVEIKGKRSGGTWVESGYVRPENLSYDEVDLAVAKFTMSALAIKDGEKKIAALTEIAENSDFSSSVFLPFINETINSLIPEEKEDDGYTYTIEENIDAAEDLVEN